APRREHGFRSGGGASRRPLPAAPLGRDGPYIALSPHLVTSPVHRGPRAAIQRREALILQAALNHPWLLHDRMQELAETEFRHADTKKLKAALIDVLAHRFGHEQESGQSGRDEEGERAELVAELGRLGFAELLARIERTITTASVWGARPQAAVADV